MAIKLNGSTSGSVALDAPADTSPSGTDVTLTLPTSAGSSGQYLQTNGTGTLSWQTVADQGEVLQVQQSTITHAGGGVATTSSTFQNTGLNVNITPSTTNSRILILSNFVIGSAGTAAWQHTTLFRGTTNLGTQFKASQPQFAGCYNNNATDIHNTASIMYVDSPGVDTQVNYSIHFRSLNNSTNVRFATDGIVATIIAIELAS